MHTGKRLSQACAWALAQEQMMAEAIRNAVRID